jgi:hypothetical protein
MLREAGRAALWAYDADALYGYFHASRPMIPAAAGRIAHIN